MRSTGANAPRRSRKHREDSNCPDCAATEEHETDLREFNESTGKRRIFIESDILHADEFSFAQREVYDILKGAGEIAIGRIFADVLDQAWHDLPKTWEAVKRADEIYAVSSLLPLSGGSYMGAPVIFNGMCERALAEGVKGKKVFILNNLKNVYWHMIDIDVMKKAFADNELYMYDENIELSKVDVNSIMKK